MTSSRATRWIPVLGHPRVLDVAAVVSSGGGGGGVVADNNRGNKKWRHQSATPFVWENRKQRCSPRKNAEKYRSVDVT